MIPPYSKIGNVLCHIGSDPSLFMSKVRVLALSMACPYCTRGWTCPCRNHAMFGYQLLACSNIKPIQHGTIFYCVHL